LVKLHLTPGGILAHWLPAGDAVLQSSVARALGGSFPYVRVFGSVEKWGWHYLASNDPLPQPTAVEMLARMPLPAVEDMIEWNPGRKPEERVNLMPLQEINIQQLLSLSQSAPPLTDDRPLNEWYFLRHHVGWVRSAVR
jgi:hypothetical protein